MLPLLPLPLAYSEIAHCTICMLTGDLGFESSQPGYSESAPANAWDVFDDPLAIMADNHTCWNDGQQPILPACPFTASSETINQSQRSSRQFLFRVAAFVLIQNAQTILILVRPAARSAPAVLPLYCPTKMYVLPLSAV